MGESNYPGVNRTALRPRFMRKDVNLPKAVLNASRLATPGLSRIPHWDHFVQPWKVILLVRSTAECMLLQRRFIECIVAQGSGDDRISDSMEGDQGEHSREEHPGCYRPGQREKKDPKNPQADQSQKPDRPGYDLGHNPPFTNFG